LVRSLLAFELALLQALQNLNLSLAPKAAGGLKLEHL
jgi:hypothetical protein